LAARHFRLGRFDDEALALFPLAHPVKRYTPREDHGRLQLRFLGKSDINRDKREDAMFKHILVPTDGSPLSDSAVARATAFAKEISARITFFYSQPDFPMPIYGEGALIDPTTPEQFARSANQEAQRILDRAKTMAEAEGVPANTDTQVSEIPYEAIISAADRHGCDLIFMASHGRRGIAGLLLGSETQKVLTHSKTPVLVYR
jgi:nucleotide-binding universal stress UspA family protein